MPTIPKKKQPLEEHGFYCTASLYRRVRRAAKIQGVSESQIVRELIAQNL